jgi:hypothetical protein
MNELWAMIPENYIFQNLIFWINVTAGWTAPGGIAHQFY